MVYLPVAACRVAVSAALQVSRGSAFLRWMGVTQLGVDLVELQGFDRRCIVVHAVKSDGRGTPRVGARLIPTALR